MNTNLLISSFLKIEPQFQEFSDTFYRILLDKYPRLRPLFADTDMEKQKEKLMESLKIIMTNVHNPEAFTTILKNLGKRHVKYGAVLADYPLVGDALLQALEKHLGTDWTPDVKETWTQAYQLISDTMNAGAEESIASPANTLINYQTLPETSLENNNINARIGSDRPSKSSIYPQLLIIVGIGIMAIVGYIVLKQPQSSLDKQSSPAMTQSN